MIRKVKVKNVFYSLVIIVIGYLAFLKPILLKASFKANVENVDCQTVLDFVADFG